jgi:hypothetical protein
MSDRCVSFLSTVLPLFDAVAIAPALPRMQHAGVGIMVGMLHTGHTSSAVAAD